MISGSDSGHERIQPLLITAGEPAGIGPELAVRLAADRPQHVLVADTGLLDRTRIRLGLDLELKCWQPGSAFRPRPGVIHHLAIALAQTAEPGVLNTSNARYVLDCLDAAVSAIQADQACGLVTAPVHKGIINDAGIAFSGHTEYLAAKAGVAQVVMLLAAADLRVALATTHLPISKVSEHIQRESLAETLRILQHDLEQKFQIQQPHIAVLGLNPHAGEGGHLGREEIEIIAPVIESLKKQGLNLTGPLPADTAFVPKHLQHYDAVLAMYHDQGLPVLKYAGFGHAVNVTLGLPFVRTSVDHGTALDIAGTGQADGGSLIAATELA
ncbi:MAG: 4-hydroxythreonine-4-phosphate dehydrogenase PdxA, partial [Pseudomonadota bacterium]